MKYLGVLFNILEMGFAFIGFYLTCAVIAAIISGSGCMQVNDYTFGNCSVLEVGKGI